MTRRLTLQWQPMCGAYSDEILPFGIRHVCTVRGPHHVHEAHGAAGEIVHSWPRACRCPEECTGCTPFGCVRDADGADGMCSDCRSALVVASLGMTVEG